MPAHVEHAHDLTGVVEDRRGRTGEKTVDRQKVLLGVDQRRRFGEQRRAHGVGALGRLGPVHAARQRHLLHTLHEVLVAHHLQRVALRVGQRHDALGEKDLLAQHLHHRRGVFEQALVLLAQLARAVERDGVQLGDRGFGETHGAAALVGLLDGSLVFGAVCDLIRPRAGGQRARGETIHGVSLSCSEGAGGCIRPWPGCDILRQFAGHAAVTMARFSPGRTSTVLNRSGGGLRAGLLALACLLVSAGAEWWRHDAVSARAAVPLLAAPAPLRGFTLVEHSSSTIPMPADTPAAHASALAALPNGELLACWWAGQRESAPDVQLYVARWRDGRWGAPHAVADRESLGRALHLGVRRIGNPVLWVGPDGRVHLYMVATGLGGWAASRVAQLVSSDGGQSFSVTRLLPLSPLWNTSVLVRTRPVAMADGGWLLPAYFELGNKYPMVISFDANGDPRWVRRVGAARTSLQPALLPLAGSVLRAVMRDHGPQRRVQQAVSRDAGLSWQDEPAAELANADNSLAGLRLANGGYVLLHNDAVPGGGGSPRQWLRLSTSSDALAWAPKLDVRRGVAGDEFSYPSVLQIGQQLHVTYTQQRSAIAHHVYDILHVGGGP